MEFLRATHYLVRSLMYLTERFNARCTDPAERANARRTEPVLLRDIAAATEAPEAFLSKVMQSARARGIVISHRGKKRGYDLARDPSKISMYDIIIASEGPVSLKTLLEPSEMDAGFGALLRGIDEILETKLRGITLQDLYARNGKTNRT